MNNTIITIIQDFLRHVGHPHDNIEVSEDREIGLVKFIVTFDDPSSIIGKNGEALRSMNYIVKKMLEKEAGSEQNVPNFVIDVNDYYGKKIENIKTKAKIIADRAVSFKREIELEPMSAYDRLIVHSYLAQFPGVETVSKGEGKDRHIVVRSIEEN
jgi:spoIIIJ-associated protein